MTTPDPNAPANPPQDPPPDPSAPKTFTQEELDRVVQDRLKREREKYPDYDELKDKAARFDELDAASKTELERAQAAATAEKARADQAETRLREAARRQAIVSEAAKAGAIDPDAVVALIDSNAVTIDDAGQVTGAETAVKELLEQKTYLVGSSKPQFNPAAANGGPRGGGLDDDDLGNLSMEDYVARRNKDLGLTP